MQQFFKKGDVLLCVDNKDLKVDKPYKFAYKLIINAIYAVKEFKNSYAGSKQSSVNVGKHGFNLQYNCDNFVKIGEL